MLQTIIGVFVVLHGLVHLLYAGQSWRLFELQAGMVWPQGSWVFSRFLGGEATKTSAGAMCVLAAVGLAAGGVGIAARQSWHRGVIVGSVVLSTLAFALFWDGSLHRLDNQGAVGILINVAVLAAVLAFRWTD